MKNRLLFGVFLICTNILEAQTIDLHFDCWTKIDIERVFVSKTTYKTYRDVFSTAEFGWQIKYKNRFVMRGDLYDTLYAPGCDLSDIKLNFVEVDVFSDDFISSTKINKKKSLYKLTKNKDQVRLSYKDTFPDRNSGDDRNPHQAILVKDKYEGSVNFNAGDFTDYIQAGRSSQASFLILFFPTANFLVMANQKERFPAKARTTRRFHLFTGSQLKFKIQGRPGAGPARYFLKSFNKENMSDNIFKFSLNYSRNLRHYNQFVEMADLLISFKQTMIQQKCRLLIYNKASENKRVLCAVILYRLADREDINKLNLRYYKESSFYKRTVKPAYKKSQNNQNG